MTFVVVIPARYASQRLPGKPLVDIAGKPMIQHVYERVLESRAEKAIIATDDHRVFSTAKSFGANVEMTSDEHRSGSDRIAEVVDKMALTDDTIVVNVQGDEPLIPALVINQVADNLALNPDVSTATLCAPIETADELNDPNVVKVVRDLNKAALYFSRASIPWDRDAHWSHSKLNPSVRHYFRHIGLYAYRVGFIKSFVTWKACEIEEIERLEQLRILLHGFKIHVDDAATVPVAGVDTDDDVKRVLAYLERDA